MAQEGSAREEDSYFDTHPVMNIHVEWDFCQQPRKKHKSQSMELPMSIGTNVQQQRGLVIWPLYEFDCSVYQLKGEEN